QPTEDALSACVPWPLTRLGSVAATAARECVPPSACHDVARRDTVIWLASRPGWSCGKCPRFLGLKIVVGRGRAALRFHLWMHVIHRGWGNSPSQEGEPARGQGVKQSVYHVSRAQNSLQDGRLETSGISMLSLWNLLRFICDHPSLYLPWNLGSLHFDVSIKRVHYHAINIAGYWGIRHKHGAPAQPYRSRLARTRWPRPGSHHVPRPNP